MVRASDSLLPQIATDIGVTVGAASIIVTAYAITHGTVQLIIGPIGDRFGKFLMVAIACALCSFTVLACGLAQSLNTLALARLASGLTAAWIIPLGMAFVGDTVPYERRQAVLGRYLTGQITGQLFGQAAGGIIGDWLGWRAVFFLLSANFALVAIALFRELSSNPTTRPEQPPDQRSRGLVADYSAVFSDRWARLVIFAAVAEAALMWGAFAYVGADLHLRFGVSFTLVGLIVGTFGIGGLMYAGAVPRLVGRFGQTGLATFGGILAGLCVPDARNRTHVVDRAACRDRNRAWILHAAQHVAGERDADDAAGARHRGRAVFLSALHRSIARRAGRIAADRPRGRTGDICDRRDPVAGAGFLVRRAIAAARRSSCARARRARFPAAPAARPRSADCCRASAAASGAASPSRDLPASWRSAPARSARAR